MLFALTILPLIAGVTFCLALLAAFPNERQAWLCNVAFLVFTLGMLGFAPFLSNIVSGSVLDVFGSFGPAVALVLISAFWLMGSWSACAVKRRLVQL